MLSSLRRHFFNNVIGYIALFIALGGTSAYALSGSNTVFSDDIASQQVQRGDVKIYGWNPLSFAVEPGGSPWRNVPEDGSGRAPAGFYKDPQGVVHLRGEIEANPNAGASDPCPGSASEISENTEIGTLPEGFRPTHTVRLTTWATGNTFDSRLRIGSNGSVRAIAGSGCLSFSLDGAHFRVDQ